LAATLEFSAALLKACTIRPTPITIVTIEASAPEAVPASAMTDKTMMAMPAAPTT